METFPVLPLKGVYISHFIRFARVSIHVAGFNARNKSLTAKLLQQGYRYHKARFIAKSSSCTTTELSKLLTSCLTAVKNHVIRYCEKVYERSGKNLF